MSKTIQILGLAILESNKNSYEDCDINYEDFIAEVNEKIKNRYLQTELI